MLENLKADQKENDEKENQQQEDYNNFVKTNKERVTDLEDALANAKGQKGESEGDAAEAKKLADDMTAELARKRESLKNHLQFCQDNRETYKDRVQERSKEME